MYKYCFNFLIFFFHVLLFSREKYIEKSKLHPILPNFPGLGLWRQCEKCQQEDMQYLIPLTWCDAIPRIHCYSRQEKQLRKNLWEWFLYCLLHRSFAQLPTDTHPLPHFVCIRHPRFQRSRSFVDRIEAAFSLFLHASHISSVFASVPWFPLCMLKFFITVSELVSCHFSVFSDIRISSNYSFLSLLSGIET